ncbi:hypothetical protein AN3130.2 [Aspergillus nidulans FGSC A4]|uniref:Conserved proline-rich protein (AFU_orthologue AFUA_3G12990) n=1 Tax=Emericella nidulans (strain FGSC A4 / ATCC 38163 / CBS 112.46 / NRRL 194 / M139) TaxID=227321 RepID=Q5B8K0_EMENI|nr:hypothetical protein [Aspergillus nidulans FGSC A4]EAA63701.1 hypothetical protein AN3130.2 [Aspergillus nidulans FGSC A4]CBF83349.1 TPA: conserved proline-rich protein (AFU_orthologue; AFUA_3G12990) [Aspergillus nidulans FGSC A4]|eukprot:XP_660734.1 hypothetical protein AN3130.2 [Aspergillus nidulans FGSC A4]
MSSCQFQLFPPPAPQGVPKNPFRRGPRQPSIDIQSTSASPLEDLSGKESEAKAVVFQVVEPRSIKTMPEAHVPPLPPRSATPKLRHPPSTESLYSSSPQETRGKSLANGVNSPSPPPSVDHYDELDLRLATSPPQPSVSPVIPIMSMFPQFNPDAPLNQQQYNDRISNNFSRPRPRPAGLKLNITPAPEIDRVLGPKTVPADVHNFPPSMHSPVEIQYSSLEQLKTLWEAANGQRADNLLKAYTLRMERIDPATFVFGDPKSPFYTMQTYSTNEISMTRGNPSISNSNIPIMMLQLEDRRRREPPNDGLVSHLFSRLAAMLAIDQATELSRQHQLAPPDAAEVEANALKRAAALESCKLSWNAIKRIYELRHPSLQQNIGALHISVSTPTTTNTGDRQIQSRELGQSRAPTILVTVPLPKNSVDVAAVASPRTSTLPLSGSESESDEPLASLDLRTMTLSVSAVTINNTIPSLYAIDSVVAAILAVAVSDVSTNPVLADMAFYNLARAQKETEMQPPQPPQPAHTNRPRLFATLAERDDTDNDNNDTPSVPLPPRSQTLLQTPPRSRIHRKWFPSLSSLRSSIAISRRRRAKAKADSLTPAAEEIDLEKYGINTSSSMSMKKETTKGRKGTEEELPGLARGILRLMSWGFKLMFWGVKVALNILGWMLGFVIRRVTGA